MARFGSSSGYNSDSLSATTDPQGNPIVSPDNSFAASPLGYAARAQALYGIANPTFSLTPPDSLGTISSGNQIPYWDTYNDGDIVPTMYFDSATETWDVDLNPSGAGSGATLTLKTRSYLLNDSNLSLRQKAYLTLTKNGSFAGTAQWQISLGAEYFTFTGTSLGSYAIGTVSHSSTWTSISGTTTSGGTAIDSSAYYVDLSVTMTALGTVTDTTTARINSLLLETSTPTAGGGGGFLVTETFLTSGTWTRPTGVEYVNLVRLSSGAGGQGGGVRAVLSTPSDGANAGSGGAGGAWLLARDLYIGDAGTAISVGIGAGGVGGTAQSFTKAAAGTAQTNLGPTAATAPGETTFGTYLSGPWYDPTTVSGGTAGRGGGPNIAEAAGDAGGNSATSAYTSFPFSPAMTSTGAAGSAASASGGSSGTAGAGGTANTSGTAFSGGGGGGGGARFISGDTNVQGGAGGTNGKSGSGAGGGGAARRVSANNGTVIVTGGAGANAPTANCGGGGGGGGAVGFTSSAAATYNSTTLTMTSGKGGDGQTGFLTVIWIG
jgi:hypothetical protein